MLSRVRTDFSRVPAGRAHNIDKGGRSLHVLHFPVASESLRFGLHETDDSTLSQSGIGNAAFNVRGKKCYYGNDDNFNRTTATGYY